MDNTTTTTGPFTITTVTSGSNTLNTVGYTVYKDDTLPVYYNLYEEDGNLFYKNSKGEVFKLTFTKQEAVKQIIQDL